MRSTVVVMLINQKEGGFILNPVHFRTTNHPLTSLAMEWWCPHFICIFLTLLFQIWKKWITSHSQRKRYVKINWINFGRNWLVCWLVTRNIKGSMTVEPTLDLSSQLVTAALGLQIWIILLHCKSRNLASGGIMFSVLWSLFRLHSCSD